MEYRLATPADLDELAGIFADAIRAVGPLRYAPEQVDAWARGAVDDASFRQYVLGVNTLIAVDTLPESGRQVMVGFAGLGAGGHVASLYVRPEHMRRGIGRGLVQALIERAEGEGWGRMHTEASHFSRPVFEACGFRMTGIERVQRRGVWFDRVLMERDAS